MIDRVYPHRTHPVFFAAAPDEELTREDVAQKTGMSSSFASDAIGALRSSGVLQQRPGIGRRAAPIYSLTPEARAVMMAPLGRIED